MRVSGDTSGLVYVVKDTVTGLYYTGKKGQWGPAHTALCGTKMRIKNVLGGLKNGNKNPLICVPL